MIIVSPHFSITYHSNEQREKIEKLIKNILDAKPNIQFNTSGSTGNPKTIQHSKSAIHASAMKTIKYFELCENDKAVLCLPVDHIAGAMMIVRSMIAGLDLNVYPTLTTCIESIEGSFNFIAIVPIQLEYAMKSDLGISRIKQFQHILIGGAPLSQVLNKQLIDHQVSVMQSFGMTETITHIALKKSGYQGEEYYQTLKGIYVGEVNEELFINYPEISDQKIKTNDRIELIDPSTFKWLGRIDSIINSGGLKISPEMVEKKLSKAIGSQFIIVGIKDEILGQKMAIILEHNNLIENQVRKAFICNYLGKLEMPKVYSIIDGFEYTANNKINRNLTIKKASHFGWKELL